MYFALQNEVLFLESCEKLSGVETDDLHQNTGVSFVGQIFRSLTLRAVRSAASSQRSQDEHKLSILVVRQWAP